MIAVEAERDRRVRASGSALLEDPLDDDRFPRVDLDLVADDAARFFDGDGMEAIRHVACGEPRQRSALESTERLVPQIVEVHIRDQALDGKRQLGVLGARIDSVGDADEWDLEELQLLEDLRRVGEVARDARHIFGDDRANAASINGGHHRLEPWTVQACARHCEVRKDLCTLGIAALLRDELTAAANLILNAALILQL